MKKLYTLILTIVSLSAAAQTPCDQGRYSTELFPNVTVTSNVNFGQNTTFSGGNMQLNMNIFEPTGDTSTMRPLIIWAHGGSFIGGSKTDGDVVALSNAFAKRGYVCASIDYRVGMFPIDSVNATKAVVRAVQDMKAAVRYFYKDRSTSNIYKIDTNTIIIGGSSAGAITALHMAYLDKTCEVEKYVNASTLATMGGIEGTSGNPGYSSNVHAAVNLAGGLASYGWMESGDIPCVSLHGDDDGTVPYGYGIASVSGFNVIHMDGSQMLEARANQVGVDHKFYTHYGAGHAPYAGSPAYMDTTIKFVSKFLTDLLGCNEPTVIAENTPTGVANLYQLDYCGLSIAETGHASVSVFPNPSNDKTTIISNDLIEAIFVYNSIGEIVYSKTVNTNNLSLEKSHFGEGMFFVKVITEGNQSSVQRVIFQ